VSWRSLYGNFSGRPSTVIEDVKTGGGNLARKAAMGFLSSSEGTFRRSGVEAFLAKRHPHPCEYEIEEEDMAEHASSGGGRHQWRKDRLLGAKRVTRDGSVLTRTDAGWVPEDAVSEMPTPAAAQEGVVCDVCGFEARSALGLGSHKRAKHPAEED
jgi:hypothetical protein